MATMLAAVAVPAAAQQAPSPSQITPRSLLPDAPPSSTQVVIPEGDGLQPPAGAADMVVTLRNVSVEGAFPEVSAQTDRIVANLRGRRVTLKQIYAAATEIESVHARAGFVLSRVAIPPQTLTDGGDLRIVVVDGFIEDISLDGIPARARKSIEARLGALKGRRHLTLSDIQQPLLIAGDTPGLRLTSTLMRGTETGGTKLTLDGKQHLLTGALGFDNNLPDGLDTYGVSAQIALNSALGLGEQIYAFVGGGYDITKLFSGDARARVLGGGIVMPIGDGRLSIDPEATFSRTTPTASSGVPLTRGDLRRLTLRTSFMAARRRAYSLSVNAAVEQIDETNLLTQFGLFVSHDRFMAARLGFDYVQTRPTGDAVSIRGQLSQGLGGLGALQPGDLTSGTTFSRQGAGLDFTKLSMNIHANMPLAEAFWLSLSARAQTTFGQAMFRSEQMLLEGNDGLSAYIGAVTAVDAGATVRGEVSRPFRHAGVQLAPYAFGAGGVGEITHPTSVEPGGLRAASVGGGIRLAFPRIGLNLGAEYAHGFADLVALDGVDRVNISASLRF
jgi:hemolysin activation/secretion protein